MKRRSKITTFIMISSCFLATIAWWWYEHRTVVESTETAFRRAIQSSDLDAVNKSIMTSLAKDPHSWKSGLLKEIVGDVSMKRVVWKSEKLKLSGKCIFVVLMDSFIFIRPAAYASAPLICIVFGCDNTVLTWAIVAPFSRGFHNAEVIQQTQDQALLNITTRANYWRGLDSYTYKVSLDHVKPTDRDGTGLGLEATTPAPGDPGEPPDFWRDPKGMGGTLDRLRQRFRDSEKAGTSINKTTTSDSFLAR